MRDPERYEHHDHRDGECDLELRKNPWQDRRACNYYARYYTSLGSKVYGRPSRQIMVYVSESNGSARAKLRSIMNEVKKLDPEDVEDIDIINPRHRHLGLWEIL